MKLDSKDLGRLRHLVCYTTASTSLLLRETPDVTHGGRHGAGTPPTPWRLCHPSKIGLRITGTIGASVVGKQC